MCRSIFSPKLDKAERDDDIIAQSTVAAHPPYRVGLTTLGCRVNQYETQAMLELLETQDFAQAPPGEVCDLYIVNTCTVTSESDRKSAQAVRRVLTQNPKAVVLVTGCSSSLSPERFAGMAGVDIICGTRSKLRAASAAAMLVKAGQKNAAPQIFRDPTDSLDEPFEPMTITRAAGGRTRVYVKIQDGCEGRCAYCIIPKVRGPIRSKPLEEAICEIRALVAEGYREVVLTGIETSAYRPGLIPLLQACEELEGLDRVSLGSLDPSLLKPAFTDELAKLNKLTPHFHLSLQSGCDRTLAAMRRRYNTRMIAEYTAYLREKIPDVTFTADVIVGFPGESEEDFASTADFLCKLKLLHMHIFTYSIRPGTEAATMKEQLPKAVKDTRSVALSAVASASAEAIIRPYVTEERVMPVLFESYENGYAVGHTPNFLEVYVPFPSDPSGRIYDIRFTKFENKKLYGECTNAR